MSACKQCGLPVQWKQTDGKWQCFDPDGVVHWDKCSQARFERIKREGEHFKDEFSEGYLTPLKKSGKQMIRISAKAPIGELRSSDCKNCVPPWEVCPNGCAAEFDKNHSHPTNGMNGVLRFLLFQAYKTTAPRGYEVPRGAYPRVILGMATGHN